MDLMPLCNPPVLCRKNLTKTLLIMKLTAFLMIVSALQLSAKGFGQVITLKLENAPIQRAFKEIEKQSGYSFVYGKEQLAQTKKVTLVVINSNLEEALAKLFKGQPLTYTISGRYISIKISNNVTGSTEDPAERLPAIEVRGRVKNDNGEPLEGISVAVKGTNVGTQTNADGIFVIEVPGENSILVFTAVGFEKKEVKVGGKTNLGDISLAISNLKLNEIVVVGYSAQRRKDITGAVSVVNASDLKSVPSHTAAAQLQGRASGVTVVLNGTPGAGAKVRVRGLGSFTNNSPLYVVDGVQTYDIAGINPNDIESMQVLKDAASSAIYGVRSSNGVIVITTKKGKKGDVIVNYDMTYGVQLPGAGFSKQVLSPMEAAEYSWMVLRNSGFPTTGTVYGNGPTPVLPDYLFAGAPSTAGVPGPLMEGNPAVDPSLYHLDFSRWGVDPLYKPYLIVKANKAGTNWWKEATRNAPIQSHNLSFSGGNDKSRFMFSMNYFDQKAITVYQYYKRYTIRLNSDFSPFKGVRFGENLQLLAKEANVQGNSDGGNQSNNQEDADISSTWGTSPMVPLRNVGGDWAGGAAIWGGKNPVALLYRRKNNRDNAQGIIGNIYGEVDLPFNLTFRSSIGGYINYANQRTYPEIEYENSLNKNVPTATENMIKTNNWIFSNILSFKKDFGKHSVSALAGSEASKSGGRQMIGSASGYSTYNNPLYINLSNGNTQSLGGSGNFAPTTLASLLASANYSFDDKYLLTASVRRDGSSKFLGDNQYGVFPSFSVGWRMTGEDFMKSINWLTDLKLRGSWGKSGNELSLNSTNGITTFGSDRQSSFYDLFGSQTTPSVGFYQNFVGNANGQWEQNISTNIGFDATLFNSTSIIFDWYKKETKDLLFNPAGQAILGAAASSNPSFKNVGSMENWGIDLLISNRAKIGNSLVLTSTLTFTTYKNKITKIADGIPFFDSDSPSSEANRLGGQTITRNMVGEAFNSYYGYKVLGIFQTQAEVDAWAEQTGGTNNNTAAPGTFKYADLSGPDGKPDGIVDSYDRTVIGSPNPDFTYGLNFDLEYKNFDMALFFYGVQGKENYNWRKWFTNFAANFGGSSKDALYNSWLPDGSRPNATVPMETSTGSFSTNQTVNSFYVEKSSYFRLRNVQLGYTFESSNLLKKIKINRMRLYLQATNLFTITNYSGLDPEVVSNRETSSGIDLGSYPTVRQISFGANINF